MLYLLKQYKLAFRHIYIQQGHVQYDTSYCEYTLVIICLSFDLSLGKNNNIVFIFTMQEMKRPFAPMKALDMEEVIEDIIKKIK